MSIKTESYIPPHLRTENSTKPPTTLTELCMSTKKKYVPDNIQLTVNSQEIHLSSSNIRINVTGGMNPISFGTKKNCLIVGSNNQQMTVGKVEYFYIRLTYNDMKIQGQLSFLPLEGRTYQETVSEFKTKFPIGTQLMFSKWNFDNENWSVLKEKNQKDNQNSNNTDFWKKINKLRTQTDLNTLNKNTLEKIDSEIEKLIECY